MHWNMHTVSARGDNDKQRGHTAPYLIPEEDKHRSEDTLQQALHRQRTGHEVDVRPGATLIPAIHAHEHSRGAVEQQTLQHRCDRVRQKGRVDTQRNYPHAQQCPKGQGRRNTKTATSHVPPPPPPSPWSHGLLHANSTLVTRTTSPATALSPLRVQYTVDSSGDRTEMYNVPVKVWRNPTGKQGSKQCLGTRELVRITSNSTH